MAQPGFGGLDTPQTNVGDATYLDRKPDFDISQEVSFQSPSKDANLLQQLRNGGRPALRTPRGSRAPFADRRNLPAGLGGAEFTPLLKSATRNSVRRHGPGKENGLATPAFLGKIDEDMTPVPAGESSVYRVSRNASYVDATPLPAVDSSSVASTPMVMRRRGGDGKGPLEDGNQLSLREQENVIDRIEKENFGLKLKIHFLEEALRKAGPGFSEAALKENTELKVDKVTMQRELQRYKKHLTSAEKELESCRQEILEVQERARKKHGSEDDRAEIGRLRQELEDREADIRQLQRDVDEQRNSHAGMERLQDDVADLEADLREKDRLLGERDDEVDDLKLRLQEVEEEKAASQRRVLELERDTRGSRELDEAKGTIEDLEATVRALENDVDDLREKLQDALSSKERAEGDLEELQEEMANKSVVTKGLSRQVEEKLARLQGDLGKAREDNAALQKERQASQSAAEDFKAEARGLREERDSSERMRGSLADKLDEAREELRSSERVRQSLATKLEEVQEELRSSEDLRKSLAAEFRDAQEELRARGDEKALLQTRHDALTNESASLQYEVGRLKRAITELERGVEQERQHTLDMERDIRGQYRSEIERLNDEISDLHAEVRERENLYDNDSEKWETERHNLESRRDRAEERAAGLQRTIDKLREAEGSLSSKESKLQDAIRSENERHVSEEAVLRRQVDELQQSLESRQAMLESLRSELSVVRDELRQSQLDQKSQAAKAEALEDEVEVLQATMDEESERGLRELERARRESDDLRQQISALRGGAAAAPATPAIEEAAKDTDRGIFLLKEQLAGVAEKLSAATKEKQALQRQLTDVSDELRSLGTELADAKAERDELEAELQQAKAHDGDTLRLDQERIELRSAKTRLDNEVRRLREENRALDEKRLAIEKALDDEIEKAAAEEDRLNQEILELQAKVRRPSESQEAASARRSIRELERRVKEYEARLAAPGAPAAGDGGEGSSELSLIRRDLTTARARELELLQREAGQKDMVKSLKRQISELERQVHDAEVSRLAHSPGSAGRSAQREEVSELRGQLSSSHQTVNELKKSLREADRKTSALARELENRVEEVEEQKSALEQALEDARLAADDAAAAYERTLKKYKHKLDRYRRERDELALRDQQSQLTDRSGNSEMSLEERRDLHAMLRESQTAADKLDREVGEQREALEELMANEANLRKKLERARGERAAYRADTEKLQHEVRALKAAKEAAEAAAEEVDAARSRETALALRPRPGARPHDPGLADTDAIIRAAEAAEQRHSKEIRGMCMQLEWVQARWERESRLRADAAYAKRYLLLELQVRDACNKADLVMLNDIMGQLKGKNRPALPAGALRRPPASASGGGGGGKTTLRRLGIAVRFVVRARLAARGWAQHDKTRRRLAEAAGEMQRQARMRKMRDEWRAQMRVVAGDAA